MSHCGGVASSQARSLFIATVAGLTGFVTWMATTASAPRFSSGEDLDMGSPALFPILLAAALLGGFVQRRPWLIGTMLGLPGLILAPWTAPRGDGDGLWILIFPLLVSFLFVLVAAAAAGTWIGSRCRAPAHRSDHTMAP